MIPEVMALGVFLLAITLAWSPLGLRAWQRSRTQTSVIEGLRQDVERAPVTSGERPLM